MSFWDNMTKPKPINKHFGVKKQDLVDEIAELQEQIAQLRSNIAHLKMARGVLQIKTTPNATLEQILSDVCEYTGFSKEQILSPSRKAKLVNARRIIVALTIASYTDTEVGNLINRDRTTVIHLRDSYHFLSSQDKQFVKIYGQSI